MSILTIRTAVAGTTLALALSRSRSAGVAHEHGQIVFVEERRPHRRAAVDHQRVAGDEAGEVGHEEQRRARDVVGHSAAAQRDVGVATRIVAARVAGVLRGPHESGHDRVAHGCRAVHTRRPACASSASSPPSRLHRPRRRASRSRAIEARCTMAPPVPRAMSRAATACEVTNAARRLRASTSSKVASEMLLGAFPLVEVEAPGHVHEPVRALRLRRARPRSRQGRVRRRGKACTASPSRGDDASRVGVVVDGDDPPLTSAIAAHTAVPIPPPPAPATTIVRPSRRKDRRSRLHRYHAPVLDGRVVVITGDHVGVADHLGALGATVYESFDAAGARRRPDRRGRAPARGSRPRAVARRHRGRVGRAGEAGSAPRCRRARPRSRTCATAAGASCSSRRRPGSSARPASSRSRPRARACGRWRSRRPASGASTGSRSTASRRRSRCSARTSPEPVDPPALGRAATVEDLRAARSRCSPATGRVRSPARPSRSTAAW